MISLRRLVAGTPGEDRCCRHLELHCAVLEGMSQDPASPSGRSRTHRLPLCPPQIPRDEPEHIAAMSPSRVGRQYLPQSHHLSKCRCRRVIFQSAKDHAGDIRVEGNRGMLAQQLVRKDTDLYGCEARHPRPDPFRQPMASGTATPDSYRRSSPIGRARFRWLSRSQVPRLQGRCLS